MFFDVAKYLGYAVKGNLLKACAEQPFNGFS